jgi:hypothetical protein
VETPPPPPEQVPPQYSPQYYASPVSPDGKYWWNGYQWVPLQRQTNPAIFLVGGCVLVLIILGIIAAIAASSFHVYYDNNQILSSISNGLPPP